MRIRRINGAARNGNGHMHTISHAGRGLRANSRALLNS
jgi:hypothetical protein